MGGFSIILSLYLTSIQGTHPFCVGKVVLAAEESQSIESAIESDLREALRDIPRSKPALARATSQRIQSDAELDFVVEAALRLFSRKLTSSQHRMGPVGIARSVIRKQSSLLAQLIDIAPELLNEFQTEMFLLHLAGLFPREEADLRAKLLDVLVEELSRTTSTLSNKDIIEQSLAAILDEDPLNRNWTELIKNPIEADVRHFVRYHYLEGQADTELKASLETSIEQFFLQESERQFPVSEKEARILAADLRRYVFFNTRFVRENDLEALEAARAFLSENSIRGDLPATEAEAVTAEILWRVDYWSFQVSGSNELQSEFRKRLRTRLLTSGQLRYPLRGALIAEGNFKDSPFADRVKRVWAIVIPALSVLVKRTPQEDCLESENLRATLHPLEVSLLDEVLPAFVLRQSHRVVERMNLKGDDRRKVVVERVNQAKSEILDAVAYYSIGFNYGKNSKAIRYADEMSAQAVLDRKRVWNLHRKWDDETRDEIRWRLLERREEWALKQEKFRERDRAPRLAAPVEPISPERLQAKRTSKVAGSHSRKSSIDRAAAGLARVSGPGKHYDAADVPEAALEFFERIEDRQMRQGLIDLFSREDAIDELPDGAAGQVLHAWQDQIGFEVWNLGQ